MRSAKRCAGADRVPGLVDVVCFGLVQGVALALVRRLVVQDLFLLVLVLVRV